MKKKLSQIINNAPLYKCALEYAGKKPARFHMPSHKAVRFCDLYKGGEFDITELDFSDNLLSASGVIAESERLLAKAYGVDRAFMLTGGATLGLYSALYVAKKRGGRIILPRNSHKSVYNALAVLNIEPYFCDVDIDEDGFAIPVTADKIADCIKKCPDASTVLITSPDYFGKTCDVKSISEVCKDKLFIVDGAHGAHFAFAGIEERAELYADICVLSMHKTMPCFTGSAVVTAKNKYADAVREGRESFHTTSPYYPAMISVDFARAFLEMNKNSFFELKKLSNELNYSKNTDFCKILLRGGESLKSYLIDHGVYPECVFGDYVLLIALPWDIKNLKRIKKLIAGYKPWTQDEKNLWVIDYSEPERAVPYCSVIDKEREWIDIESSLGRVSAGEVGLYPPGVPLVARGEIIDKNKHETLLKYKNSLFGVDSGRISVLK